MPAVKTKLELSLTFLLQTKESKRNTRIEVMLISLVQNLFLDKRKLYLNPTFEVTVKYNWEPLISEL